MIFMNNYGQTCYSTTSIFSSVEFFVAPFISSFQAIVPYMGQEKGSFFTGVYLPQKSVLSPPIESQYKPFQKHVSSYQVNRTPAIRNLPLRFTPIFANKNHALNTLKMGPLLRINVMLPQGVSGYFESVRLVEL
jgi:hypothetical protein